MFRALFDVEAVRRDSIAVAAADTARAIVVHAQLDATERALSFDDSSDGAPCLIAQRLVHAGYRLAPLPH